MELDLLPFPHQLETAPLPADKIVGRLSVALIGKWRLRGQELYEFLTSFPSPMYHMYHMYQKVLYNNVYGIWLHYDGCLGNIKNYSQS